MPIFPSAQDKLVRPYPFARPRAPGCTTRTFSNICLHCLTYEHTLPESREMWHFRMKCVVDDTSGGGRIAITVTLLSSTSSESCRKPSESRVQSWLLRCNS